MNRTFKHGTNELIEHRINLGYSTQDAFAAHAKVSGQIIGALEGDGDISRNHPYLPIVADALGWPLEKLQRYCKRERLMDDRTVHRLTVMRERGTAPGKRQKGKPRRTKAKATVVKESKEKLPVLHPTESRAAKNGAVKLPAHVRKALEKLDVPTRNVMGHLIAHTNLAIMTGAPEVGIMVPRDGLVSLIEDYAAKSGLGNLALLVDRNFADIFPQKVL